MQASSVIEVLTAAHLSVHVDSPFSQRGGIMLVAPPASLKSSMIKMLELYPTARVISDLNAQQLMKMRESIADRLFETLAFPELDKLYQRHESTALNIEGHLRGMTDEGFGATSHDDQRAVVRVARCLVIGGMVPAIYKQKISVWIDGGFARRFLWCQYALDNPYAIIDAIHEWRAYEFIRDPLVFAIPRQQKIPYLITEKESKELIDMLRFHSHIETPLILLKKILCVLRWRYADRADKQKPLDILRDFATSLQKEPCKLKLNTVDRRPVQSIRQPRPAKRAAARA